MATVCLWSGRSRWTCRGPTRTSLSTSCTLCEFEIRQSCFRWAFYQEGLLSRYSRGVMSPGRHVRTRLYFTSESHVHSLLSIFRYGGLLDVSGWPAVLTSSGRGTDSEMLLGVVFLPGLATGGEGSSVEAGDGLPLRRLWAQLHDPNRHHAVRGQQ